MQGDPAQPMLGGGGQKLRDYDLAIAPSEPLVEWAFVIARRYNCSFSDSIYVALAVSQDATLLTEDEELATATAAYLPPRRLGALRL